jgi:hypothetical protein
MSTAPRNEVNTADAPGHAVVMPSARPDLDELVQRFECAAESLAVEPPPSPELRQLCSQVAGFTAELFPGEMRVEVKNDPEIPDDIFFRFGVDAMGTIDDIAARNDEWHARVCRLPARFSGMFRLSVTVR